MTKIADVSPTRQSSERGEAEATQTNLATVARALRHVLTEVAEAMAKTSGFVQRRRKLTGSVFVRTVVLGFLKEPQASYGQLAQMAAALGVIVSRQAIEQRYGEKAAMCLQGVLEAAVKEVISADPVAIPLLQRFHAVVIYDSSTVGLPNELATLWRGCGERTGQAQAAVKLQVRLDLLTGQLDGPHLRDGRSNDRTSPHQAAAIGPGALRIHDLGFFSLDAMRDAAARQEYWLTRLQVQTALYDQRGTRLNLLQYLLAARNGRVDRAVQVGARHRLPARLLVVRMPAEVAAQRRKALRTEAAHKGQAVSTARLALADWTILVTNVPSALLKVEEAMVLYRVRWQIELLFKLWKKEGLIDESTSEQKDRILGELYAKLLAMVIQHWAILTRCWEFPARSLVQASQVVRDHAIMLAHAFAGRGTLLTALEAIGQCLSVCKMDSRRKDPHTYQLLLALHESGP